jgi:Icc protein
MKIIHISDTHLVSKRAGHYASDPILKLKKAVESINKYQSDADFLVITGDLADTGSLDAYIDLREILDELLIPYYLIIGNHDSRENFFQIFGDKCDYQDSFTQFPLVKDDKHLLFLDTKFEEWHDGGFSQERFEWIENQLQTNSNLPTYLFMHHPPFLIHHKQMDDIGFRHKEQFWEMLSKYQNVKHIFFGHVHLLINGSYRGVSYSSVRSTNHQVALLSQDKELYFNSNEQPTYAVVNIDRDQVNTISHEYLNEELIYPSFIPMDKCS